MASNLKILALTVAALVCTQLRLTAADYGVYVYPPPSAIKVVRPEFPIKFALRGVGGRGVFLLKVNPTTGVVDEVKIVRSTGFRALNELAVRAFFDWKFKPGTTQAKVPCEFFVTGFSRDLH